MFLSFYSFVLFCNPVAKGAGCRKETKKVRETSAENIVVRREESHHSRFASLNSLSSSGLALLFVKGSLFGAAIAIAVLLAPASVESVELRGGSPGFVQDGIDTLLMTKKNQQDRQLSSCTCTGSKPCKSQSNGLCYAYQINTSCNPGLVDCTEANGGGNEEVCYNCFGSSAGLGYPCQKANGVCSQFMANGECSPGTIECGTGACINIKWGRKQDVGCPPDTPVCSLSETKQPRRNKIGTECRVCIHNQPMSGIDAGCTAYLPLCASGVCVAAAPASSAAPSMMPTDIPSALPLLAPSATPSVAPSVTPTDSPSALPSLKPSATPSVAPSVTPTDIPSALPSLKPSATPSVAPSVAPTDIPSALPSLKPSATPSVAPSMMPTDIPSAPPSAGIYPFKVGVIDMFPSIQGAMHLVKSLGGNFDGNFGDYPKLLPLKDCKILQEHADIKLQELVATNVTDDFRLEVTPEELKNLIGSESVHKLHTAFRTFDKKFPVSRIVLRRTHQTGDQYVEWHNDGPTQFMLVSLNGDELDGGDLHYLTREGTIPTTAHTGDGFIHTSSIVHAVSKFQGTRYILGLLGESLDSQDIFQESIFHRENMDGMSPMLGQEL